MTLPIPDIDRFYMIWRELLFFVNQQRKLVPELVEAGQVTRLGLQKVAKLRDALWSDDGLLEAFIAQNPASLPPDDLALAGSWKHRRSGNFFLFKHLKKYSLFIAERRDEVFAVKGLYSLFEEVIPFTPILMKAVLLPYGDEITYDGIVAPYNVTFGGGIRSNLKAIYDDARERGAIITSLSPTAAGLSPQEEAAKTQATNASVLKAFQKYLYQSGRNPKIVERDLATVAAFGLDRLEKTMGADSLREIDARSVNAYLSSLPEGDRKQAITAFKRFVNFMVETGRLDWESAGDLRSFLKGGP